MADEADNDQDKEEIIEISTEDLPPEPLPEVEAQSGDILVVEPEDIKDVPDEPPTLVQSEYPPVTDLPTTAPTKKGVLTGGLVGSNILQMAIAGLVGGFLAWAVAEPFVGDVRSAGGLVAALLAMGSFGAILGGVIGLALGSIEGIVSGVWEKAATGGGLGLAIGGLGGAFGGLLGQVVYAVLGGGQEISVPQIATRAFAWGVVGLFVGLGQGVMMRAPQKIVNGLIGGAVGGFIGGFLFDPLSLVAVGIVRTLGGTMGGELSRMVGMTVMGGCAGVAIGLVEEIRKEAWLTIMAGPLQGKQFIIYRSPTVIGSSPQADICLIKDTRVAPQHAQIHREGNRHILSDLGGQTLVNRHPISQCQLREGDYVQVGQTVLQYDTRAVESL